MGLGNDQPRADYGVLMKTTIYVDCTFNTDIFRHPIIANVLLKTANTVGFANRNLDSRRIREMLYNLDSVSTIVGHVCETLAIGECMTDQSWYTTNLQKRRYLDKNDWSDYENLPNYYKLMRETNKRLSNYNATCIEADVKSIIMDNSILDNVVEELTRFDDYCKFTQDKIREILVENLGAVDLDSIGKINLQCSNARYERSMEMPLVIKDKEHSASFCTFEPDKYEPDIELANIRITILEHHLDNINRMLNGDYSKTNVMKRKAMLAEEFKKLDQYKDKYNWIASDFGYA